jgi:hypothetical protein
MNRRGFLKTTLAGTTAFILGNKLPEVLTLKEPPKGFRTGLEALDTYAGGFEKGDYVTILGERASGKTALAHQICSTNGKDGHRVLKLSESGLAYYTEGLYDNIIVDFPTIDYVFERCNSYDLIVIDSPMIYGKFGSYTETDHFINKINLHFQLKQLAHMMNKAIILVISLNRSEIFSDNVITETQPTSYYPSKVYKINKHSNICEISVAKNRYGPNNMSVFYMMQHFTRNGLGYLQLIPHTI